MDSDIKGEFKAFIRTLSTEISKEVLLEDLKDLNTAFEKTSSIYESLIVKHARSLEDSSIELSQFQNTNRILHKVVDQVSESNNKVNTSLQLINGQHQQVIDDIIRDNEKIHDEYMKNIQAFNAAEKKAFQTELRAILKDQGIQDLARIEVELMDIQGTLIRLEEIGSANTLKMINSSQKTMKDHIAAVNKDLNDELTILNRKNNILSLLAAIIIMLCLIILFNN